jgi:hypothetical protein
VPERSVPDAGRLDDGRRLPPATMARVM